MANISERYSSAIHSKSLVVDERTTFADTDVLGAYGIADRDLTRGRNSQGDPIRPARLAVPLERLLAGDHKAAHTIVAELADMAFSYSHRIGVRIGRPVAHDLACCCLAWFRSGTCKACAGHGYTLTPGAPMLSDRECAACRGTGKLLLEDGVDPDRKHPGYRDIARWLVVEIEREAGRAGPVVMAKIAPRLEL